MRQAVNIRGTIQAFVAPDAFKEPFGAEEVARAIGGGLERGGVDVDVCPVADGGEGTLSLLAGAWGGRLVNKSVRDPLGREITAPSGVVRATAIVEAAAASGLSLLAASERDPWRASTYGTAQLPCAAAQASTEVIVAVGGTAIVDGGMGALQAIKDAGGLLGANLIVLCDVDTVWEHAAVSFGPPRGDDHGRVTKLSARLDAFAADSLATRRACRAQGP